MSTLLRNYVRKWTKLPATTCSSFIHLSTSNGGLGIPNLRWKIPELTRDRLVKLQKSRVWFIQEVIKSRWYRDELYRVDALCPIGSTEKWLIQDMALANPGHMAFLTGGAKFANRHLTGGSFVEGKRFYRLAQLRSMADNPNSRRARSPLVCNKCNDEVAATLQHILCHCEDNERNIRNRHDRVLKEVISHCNKAGLAYTKEPTLQDGLRPDLIVTMATGETLCLDVTIVFELNKNSLIQACQIKADKYKRCLPEIAATFAPDSSSKCDTFGLVFGARGSIAAQTLNVLTTKLKMPKWRIERMINLIITFSLEMFEHSPLCSRASANNSHSSPQSTGAL